MKTSELLKEAANYLSNTMDDNGEQFICWAIGCVNAAGKRMQRDTKEMVTSRLGSVENGTHTLEGWLEAKHGIKCVAAIYNGSVMKNYQERSEYYAKVQRTRHAWIDSMIKEFEAKGD